jgi:hypothetical protein
VVTVILEIIISLYMLPEILLNYFYFKDRKEAADRARTWAWVIGALTLALLLTKANSYLIQQGI